MLQLFIIFGSISLISLMIVKNIEGFFIMRHNKQVYKFMCDFHQRLVNYHEPLAEELVKERKKNEDLMNEIVGIKSINTSLIQQIIPSKIALRKVS